MDLDSTVDYPAFLPNLCSTTKKLDNKFINLDASTILNDTRNVVDETLDKTCNDENYNETFNATSVDETIIENEPFVKLTTTIEKFPDSQIHSYTTDISSHNLSGVLVPESQEIPLKDSNSFQVEESEPMDSNDTDISIR